MTRRSSSPRSCSRRPPPRRATPSRARGRHGSRPRRRRGGVGEGRRASSGARRSTRPRFRALWTDAGPLPALRRHRPRPLAHDDAARRPPVGRGGRRDLPRPRPLGARLLRARDQPRERRLRRADDRALAEQEAGLRLEPRRPRDARPRPPRRGREADGLDGDRVPAVGGPAPAALGRRRRPAPEAGATRGASTCSAIERPGGRRRPEKDVVAVAWSPTGEPSFHVPRAFRDLVFARGEVAGRGPEAGGAGGARLSSAT